MDDSDRALVVTSDDRIRDSVLAAAATAGVDLHLLDDPAEAAALRASPELVIVGIDMAHVVPRLGSLRRSAVHLVGSKPDAERLCQWSAALNAAVVVLPEGMAWLTSTLAGGRARSQGRAFGVLGGAGGVGASTLTASLAWQASQEGHRVVLVDLDPCAGGVDLMLGVEQDPGWRWPALTAAEGFLGDLHDHLPKAGELAVLTHDRADPRPLSGDAVASVLRSLRRSHDLVMLDLGRGLGPAEAEAIRACDGLLVVCPGDVRGLAGVTQLLARLDPGLPVAAVASEVRGRGSGEAGLRHTLQIPVLASIPQDRRLAVAAEAGDPPGRAAGRRWRSSCAAILEQLEVGEVA